MPNFNHIKTKFARVYRRRIYDIFGDKSVLFHKLAYIFRDPWGFKNSPKEATRFQQTNEIIQKEFGNSDLILELGCGEGHQSLYLTKLCRRLVGIDCSQIAIDRAKKALPSGEFYLQDLKQALKRFNNLSPDTLVVAAEVLYYSSNPREEIQLIEKNYNKAIISTYKRQFTSIDPLLDKDKWKGPELIIASDQTFYVYCLKK